MFVFQLIALAAMLLFIGRFAWNICKVGKITGEQNLRFGVFEYILWGIAVSASLISIALK